jgi:hypothetical protein
MATNSTPYWTSVHLIIHVSPILYQLKPSIITPNWLDVQQNVCITLNATMLRNSSKMQLGGGVH